MKKSTRNILIVLIIILSILSLISFNVNGIKKLFNKNNLSFIQRDYVETEEMEYDDYGVAETMVASTNGYKAKASMKEVPIMMSDFASYATGENGNIEINTNERKLIKNIDLNCETQDFDKIYDLISEKVKQYNGIVDSENYNNGRFGSKAQRNCYFNIRVPKDDMANFVSDISKEVNVLSKYENVQDVTDNYNDTVARLNTSKLTEAKLLELLTKAKDIKDLISIEDKLANVRSEIESIERRIKGLDKKIDYSTINLSLNEVVVLTRPEDIKPTRDALIIALKKNFEDTKNFIINTGYYIFTHLPAICLVLCMGLVVLILLILILGATDNTEKVNKKEINKEVSSKDLKKDTDELVVEEEDIYRDENCGEIEEPEKIVEEVLKKDISDEVKEEKLNDDKKKEVVEEVKEKIEEVVEDAVDKVVEDEKLEGRGLGIKKNVFGDKPPKKDDSDYKVANLDFISTKE